MARFVRSEGHIEVAVALVGTAHASDKLWAHLRELATQRRGDHSVIIPEREPPQVRDHVTASPQRLVIERAMLAEQQVGVAELVERLQRADALIVALDVTGDEAAGTRTLAAQLERAFALLDPPGWQRPKVLFGLGAEDAPLWVTLLEGWRAHPPAVMTWAQRSDGFGEGLLRDGLRALTQRCRVAMKVWTPSIDPIDPMRDLPEPLVQLGSALHHETARAEPDPKGEALMHLSVLYRQAGHTTVARELLREAFGLAGNESVWRMRPLSVRPIFTFEVLRRWPLSAVEQPRDLALTRPDGASVLLLTSQRLLRFHRNSGGAEDLRVFERSTFERLCSVDDHRLLCVGADRLTLLSSLTGSLQREEPLPGSLQSALEVARERMAHGAGRGPTRGPIGRPGRERRASAGGALSTLSLTPHPDGDRVLIASPQGLWLIDLERLTLQARLDRQDVIAAAFTDDGAGVWTAHASGMVGRWTPPRAVIERVANLPVRPFAAAIARDARRLLLLSDAGRSREHPTLLLCDLLRGDVLGEATTVGASWVAIAPDGARALTLEERLLRVRDLTQGLGEADQPRSLLDAGSWLPAHIAWRPEANLIALCSTPRGGDDAQVILWG